MADSLSHLDKKKVSGLEEVTAIRTEADFRENRRRIKVSQLVVPTCSEHPPAS